MYTQFFWDLDGTLYDTYPKMVAAFAEMLAQFKLPVDRQRIYYSMRQESLGVAFNQYAQQYQIPRTKMEAVYYPLERREQNPALFTGVREILETVVNRGGRNFLLTHRDQSALTFMTRDGLTSLFSDFVTAQQPFPRKPDPTSLNFLIERNEVVRQHAVMVGDRNLDVDAAHNAQIAGILFDPDDLIKVTSRPERKIHQMDELIDMVGKTI